MISIFLSCSATLLRLLTSLFGSLLVSDLRESNYDVTVTLADQQADPNSPLFSVKAFEDLGLHENLLKGIYGMRYQKPSKIQERALPLLLQNP